MAPTRSPSPLPAQPPTSGLRTKPQTAVARALALAALEQRAGEQSPALVRRYPTPDAFPPSGRGIKTGPGTHTPSPSWLRGRPGRHDWSFAKAPHELESRCIAGILSKHPAELLERFGLAVLMQ